MSEIVNLYDDFSKAEIIAGLQKYLKDNKMHPKYKK